MTRGVFHGRVEVDEAVERLLELRQGPAPGLDRELLDLREGRCVFAIESDLVVQEQAWSSAD